MFHVMVAEGITYLAVAEEVGQGVWRGWGTGAAVRVPYRRGCSAAPKCAN